MWFLVLTFCAIAFFVMYKIFDHRISSSSPVQDLIRKHKKEVESTMVLFNKTAYENISALEAKLIETREMVKILERQLQEAKRLENVAKKNPVAVVPPAEVPAQEIPPKAPIEPVGLKLDVVVKDPPNVVPFSIAAKSPARRSKNKKDLVVELFNQGEKISDIASQLDISQEEVKYYVKRFVRL
jgi:transposase-like protein